MKEVHNFSAGPAILPQQAIDASIEALREFKNMGLSLVEISHRSAQWEETMQAAVNLVRELLKVPDDYSILFLQGGASTQFCMVPYNLLSENGTAAYVKTGTWAKKAIKEAQLFGNVQVLGSSEDKNFSYIPKDFSIPGDADYFHCTSNNTIFGTQMKEFPDSPIPMVCDMSSDIFSRPVDVSKFGIIYAGAQKNMGPAGTTLVIIKNELFGKSGRKIPSMLDYKIHAENDSMFNTCPVFPIYLSFETLKWLKGEGGVEGIAERNKRKAEKLYKEIDDNPMFVGTAAKEDRSYMNICFLLKDDSLNNEFMKAAKEANISGIKGHRSVGGFRASTYNALPEKSVDVLIGIMKEFANKHA
ncbi:MAG: 3-phosphoserine/phosphohydroxythreonine transaminase [Bacteroidia bacterium]